MTVASMTLADAQAASTQLFFRRAEWLDRPSNIVQAVRVAYTNEVRGLIDRMIR